VLLLVRHGQSVLNAEGRLAGRLDVPLTELGIAQAAAVAAAVAAMARPDRVISSPLDRARATAAAFGVAPTIDERWIELDYGAYDGIRLTEVPDEVSAAWRRDPAWAPSGGESLVELGIRVRAACADALGDGVTVVVSHVSPIKAAVAWALGVGDDASWRMFVAPASITVIGSGPHGPVLRAFNVTSHLSALTGP